jgi:hypothetical protein
LKRRVWKTRPWPSLLASTYIWQTIVFCRNNEISRSCGRVILGRIVALQYIVVVVNYSRKSLESGSAFIAKVRRAKSLESAIQSQSDYAKSAYTEFVAYLVKMSDLYCNLFKRGSTPTEKAAAKIEGVKV